MHEHPARKDPSATIPLLRWINLMFSISGRATVKHRSSHKIWKIGKMCSSWLHRISNALTGSLWVDIGTINWNITRCVYLFGRKGVSSHNATVVSSFCFWVCYMAEMLCVAKFAWLYHLRRSMFEHIVRSKFHL